ncbi:hypothetical protein GCG21_07565 [Pseudactinotalea sp. HY160]|uniref:hypothetical protein n=1 Tax=Pseudactinotalea sp. HY160 TaxID=2654490 RepID=UPI00128B9AEE|nr:hypothetical protein [Pseudactinotalea sp. HY160]MPV49862.1 hypothetical protein [Pseudactinotalea sp. HY160]
MNGASTADWFRLPARDRIRVIRAIDRGERMPDDDLRPIAAMMAEGHLAGWGLSALRYRDRFVFAAGVYAAAALLVALTGPWWQLVLLTVLVALGFLAGLWFTERQARRLRPAWRRAVTANRDASKS